MASNPNYCDITPEIEALAAQSLQNSSIDAGDYVRYDVKRGLRDLNGKGVLAGLTEISDIVAKKWWTGGGDPCGDKLYYRGYRCRAAGGQSALQEERFGFEGGGLSAAGGPPAHRNAEAPDFRSQLAYYGSPAQQSQSGIVVLEGAQPGHCELLARERAANLASHDDSGATTPACPTSCASVCS
ncbi:MAG: hypothetical protein ACLRWQ_01815 [Flavonifractor plautii]